LAVTIRFDPTFKARKLAIIRQLFPNDASSLRSAIPAWAMRYLSQLRE